MFEHLDRFDRPVIIVETGCAENFENWGGNGCSTLMFDNYVRTHPGSEFWSVDVNPQHVELCRSIASERTHIVCQDSIEFLKDRAEHIYGVDLLYLDASHLEWRAPLLAQMHHVGELMAAKPMLRSDTLVAVDDSPIVVEDWPYIETGGKGGLVAKYAAEVGAQQVFWGYQVGWTGMVNPDAVEVAGKTTISLKELLRRASEAFQANRMMDANNLFRLILQLTPGLKTKTERIARAEACIFFAKMAMVAKRLGTALDWYQQAVNLDPQEVGYRLEMIGQVLRPMRHWARAISEATVATRVEPDNVHAWRMLGGIYLWSEDLDGAKHAFRRAMEIAPDSPEPKLDMMSALFDEDPDEKVYAEIGKLAHEVELMQTGLKGDAVQVKAFIAYREGRHDDAVALFDEALKLGVSEVPTCHWNRGLALHCLGRYREGWEEHVWRGKERTQLPIYVPINRFKSAMWAGEPPPARIHAHAEAGFGDNFCCARYVKLLADRGYEVTYETYANMLDLMARSLPGVRVIPQSPDYPGAVGVPPFDYHAPLGELPRMFGTDLDTVPESGPYLKPDPGLVEAYRDKMPQKPSYRPGPWVGLCWSAGIREGLWIAKYGQRKSMYYDQLARLLRRALKVNFVSLQVGPERQQHRSSILPAIVDVLPDDPTWDDTAALIANLDLVISVDTAVAHLAGAMGKPVWLMNSAEPGSWHWMAERPGSPWNERSPWYPSVRIYRQKAVGAWDGVVGRIAADLERGDLDDLLVGADREGPSRRVRPADPA